MQDHDRPNRPTPADRDETAAGDRRPARPPRDDPSAAHRSRIERVLVVVAAVILFLLACVSDVYRFAPTHHNPSPSISGFFVLLVGWVGLPMGIVAWYANPLHSTALLLFIIRKYRSSCCCACAALAIGSTSLWVREWPNMNRSGHGGGSDAPIVGWGPGLWAWLGSMALVAVAALWFWLRAAAGDRDRRLADSLVEPAEESD